MLSLRGVRLRVLVVLAGVVAGGLLVSCGGSGSSSGGGAGSGGVVVARVGSTPITRAAVSHWMETFAGGEYHELSRAHTIPPGLVSDPPDYARCVASLQAAQAASPKKIPDLTGAKLLAKCRLLYLQLRTQATAYLVKNAVLTAAYHENGVSVSDPEVSQAFARYKAETYPTQAQQERYLAERKLSVSDELLTIKMDLLAQKATKKFTTGGKQVFAAFLAAQQRWTTKTTCSAGYVVEDCQNYTNGTKPYGEAVSPAILMEQVATIATGRCTNLAACAHQ